MCLYILRCVVDINVKCECSLHELNEFGAIVSVSQTSVCKLLKLPKFSHKLCVAKFRCL